MYIALVQKQQQIQTRVHSPLTRFLRLYNLHLVGFGNERMALECLTANKRCDLRLKINPSLPCSLIRICLPQIGFIIFQLLLHLIQLTLLKCFS